MARARRQELFLGDCRARRFARDVAKVDVEEGAREHRDPARERVGEKANRGQPPEIVL